jgi:hypothetical protein
MPIYSKRVGEKMTQALHKIQSGVRKLKEKLPKEAFAIVGDPDDPETWKLPHHTRAIFRALSGKLSIESTVDWDRMPAAVAALSPAGYRGQRVDATAEQIVKAAKHLASHYRKAGKDLPETLMTLIGQ